MPAPKPFPCGGPGQPACPPVDSAPIKVNVGDVIETPDGQKHAILEAEEDGDDTQ